MTLPVADRPLGPMDALRRLARTDPDRVALSDDVASVTYAELVDRVDAIAGLARAALGDQPRGTFLPILVDRSAASALAVLAVLVGRVPFVPVDAATAPELASRLRERTGGSTVALSTVVGATRIPGWWSSRRARRVRRKASSSPGRHSSTAGESGGPSTTRSGSRSAGRRCSCPWTPHGA